MMSVKEYAESMNISVAEVLKKCEELGIIEGVDVYPTKVRVDKENEAYEPWQKENKGNLLVKQKTLF